MHCISLTMVAAGLLFVQVSAAAVGSQASRRASAPSENIRVPVRRQDDSGVAGINFCTDSKSEHCFFRDPEFGTCVDLEREDPQLFMAIVSAKANECTRCLAFGDASCQYELVEFAPEIPTNAVTLGQDWAFRTASYACYRSCNPGDDGQE
ncbi:hypothetical protein L227DRAFT_656850 [Lentinus tigrinus ALCF2SS1-6]|uniref:Apple domain-containing protein n=1 Tax=Lentinus tigrinus ALCF2SS1-6 TaxID=1328759 RepID=A0A5C2RX88_9APHY|nr:hypothetical protein L227DRAFT_656850 [Lentinus tigrinus ALCF2SS1-6]